MIINEHSMPVPANKMGDYVWLPGNGSDFQAQSP